MKKSPITHIPLLQWDNIYSSENPIETISISSSLFKVTDDLIALKINGNTLAPTFCDGDIIIVKNNVNSADLKNGSFMVFSYSGGAIKQKIINLDGSFEYETGYIGAIVGKISQFVI